MTYSNDFLEQIRAACPMETIAGNYVNLIRRGRHYVCNCPFHSEKSPSCTIFPETQSFYCFGCGAGGDVITWVRRMDNLEFTDAVKQLAERCGLQVPTDREADRRAYLRTRVFAVNRETANFYFRNLISGSDKRGLQYFISRQLKPETIKKYGLGYASDSWNALTDYLLQKGFTEEELLLANVAHRSNKGNLYDAFRGRVMFPIVDTRGAVIGFGGRVLDDSQPKYLNTAKTPVFDKGSNLFSLNFAKDSSSTIMILAEGYMDVIGMHQVGVENVVASSGTALTQGQIRLIHRFTNNITVLYDGDAAGIKAALRGIDMLLEEGMNVKVVLLPAGEDPDSFARSHSASEFAEFISQNETDFIRFKTKLLLAEAGGDPIKRSALISDIIRTVAIIPDNIARSVYIRECSTTMEIDEQVLLNEVNKIRLNKEENQAAKSVRNTPPVQPPANTIPEYPDFPGYQPYTPEEANTLPPENIPPPLPEDYIPEEEAGPPPTPPYEVPTAPNIQVQPKRSPFEAYELALLRYIVRYGERVLYDYVDEETNEHVIMRVADYIRFDLERDDLTFYTPAFKQMLDEAAEHCQNEGFMASRYFLAHPDPNISRLAANLISDKYQLSKYHTKFRELEQEEDKLDYLVPREIYSMKDAYILYKIKDIQAKIKEAQNKGDMEQIFDLMKQNAHLNEIKNVLCKELGERIVLKM